MNRYKLIFWIALTVLIFAFFRWLAGMAVPGAELAFSLGATITIVSGLLAGRALAILFIRAKGSANWEVVVTLLIVFIIAAFIFIAFLLNAMIEKTTLFPFAVTVLMLFLINAALGAVVTIIRHRYKTKIATAQAAMAQSRSELQLLQAQLSPHFLFNTLNNLYGLSMSDPGRVPPLLLKLSDLLRYSVYDVKDIFVPLQNEIDYINNYVEFERLRLGERLKLNLAIDLPSDVDCRIPPLMLIVFVENAFKHSRTTGDESIHIDIQLRKRVGGIVFSVTNSHALAPASPQHPEKHSGFGLESVRKRLNLLYANSHKLRVDKTESAYIVQLELDC